MFKCSKLERLTWVSRYGLALCYHPQMDDKTTRTVEGMFVALVLGVAMWVGVYVLWT